MIKCPVCGKLVRLTLHGRVKTHSGLQGEFLRKHDWAKCPGSSRKVAHRRLWGGLFSNDFAVTFLASKMAPRCP